MDDEKPAPRGADLAREALAAARASTAARRKAAGRTPRAGRGSAGNLRRRRWSGSGPDARDPHPLGATLRTWVASAGAGADLKKATLFGKWEKIVGPDHQLVLVDLPGFQRPMDALTERIQTTVDASFADVHVVLVVLDGWGHRAEREGNAIELGRTPVWHGVWQRAPRTLL